jgi:hypothetical protein
VSDLAIIIAVLLLVALAFRLRAVGRRLESHLQKPHIQAIRKKLGVNGIDPYQLLFGRWMSVAGELVVWVIALAFLVGLALKR